MQRKELLGGWRKCRSRERQKAPAKGKPSAWGGTISGKKIEDVSAAKEKPKEIGKAPGAPVF